MEYLQLLFGTLLLLWGAAFLAALVVAALVWLTGWSRKLDV